MALIEKKFQVPEKSELEFLERLAQVDPSSPALLDLSRAYLAQNQPESSARLAQEILSAHPGHLDAVLLAAQALLEQNRMEAATEILEQASSRLEEMALIFRELASLFETVGDTEQAARVRDASLALIAEKEADGTEEADLEASEGTGVTLEGPVPTETLARLYLDQGSVEKALEIYHQILEANPDNDGIRERIAEIEELPAPLAEEVVETEPESSRDVKMRYINKLVRLQLAAQNVRKAAQAGI
ncbi:MAG: tetratricopeptide repeat protein [Deltaproteobacteria bacterium]|nr:tetratricopeptide repeat protein [Deltaproteobacteria bacterium]